MVKTKYETKRHVVTDRVLISERRFCDMCGEEIVGPYWEVDTGHNDWGNDSCESVENFDVCSRGCLNRTFDYYMQESNSEYNTRYLEVRHTRSSGVRGEIDYDENY